MLGCNAMLELYIYEKLLMLCKRQLVNAKVYHAFAYDSQKPAGRLQAVDTETETAGVAKWCLQGIPNCMMEKEHEQQKSMSASNKHSPGGGICLHEGSNPQRSACMACTVAMG